MTTNTTTEPGEILEWLQKHSALETPVDDFKNYIIVALDPFEKFNLLNLTEENCRDICNYYRISWRNPVLKKYLNEKGIKIYINSSSPDEGYYVLEFNDSIYLESDNFLVPIKLFATATNFRYLRRVKKNQSTFVIAVGDNTYYTLNDYPIVPDWNELDHIRVLKNHDGWYDIMNTVSMEIFTFWFTRMKCNHKGYIKMFLDETTYIEYDWFVFWSLMKLQDSFPVTWWESIYSKKVLPN
jgi:hypothetical protein